MFFPPPATHHHRGQTTTPTPHHGGSFSSPSPPPTSVCRASSTPGPITSWLPQFADLRRSLPPRCSRHVVVVTGDAGFFASYVFLALKKWGGAVTLPTPALLAKLLEIAAVTHVMHLAALAGVCYANPAKNVHSTVAALVTLLATCTLSSSVYRLNDKVPLSEDENTDQPASLYAATKKKKHAARRSATSTASPSPASSPAAAWTWPTSASSKEAHQRLSRLRPCRSAGPELHLH